MYANITSHNVKTRGVSSGNIFQYLDKENQYLEKIRRLGKAEQAGRNISLTKVLTPMMKTTLILKISVEVATR